ncbi:MAG TPA: hypothetical protein VIY48_16175 [Candidatus Paceibacterota bacterium]
MNDNFDLSPQTLVEGPGGEGYDPSPSYHPPAGDWKDDDGQALDDYFKAMAQGPEIYKAIQALVDSIKPPESTRFMSYRFLVTPTNLAFPFAATPIFPADRNRQSLVIQPAGGTNGSLFMSDQNFTAVGPAGSAPQTQAFAIPGTQQLVIPNYTGALWVASAGITASTCQWDFLAITS